MQQKRKEKWYKKWKPGKIYRKYEKSILGKKLLNPGKVFEKKMEWKKSMLGCRSKEKSAMGYKSFSQLRWKFLLKCRSNVYTSFDVGNFSNKLSLSIISRSLFCVCVRYPDKFKRLPWWKMRRKIGIFRLKYKLTRILMNEVMKYSYWKLKLAAVVFS